MKLQKYFCVKTIHQATRILVLAVFVAGCSASSESVVPDTESSVDSTTSEPDSTGESSENTNGNNPVVSDPLTQNSVVVSFDITVPYYLSDELRLELIWGDIKLTAKWVGGQYWSATGEFPTETAHLLEITLFDNYGALELARYSQEYRVGSNVDEAVQITAAQFDSDQFDSDEDGVSNLVELNAGTDPLVNEDSLLDIVDFYALSGFRAVYSRVSASHEFESRMPDDRPFVNVIEFEFDSTDSDQQVFGNFIFDIDANGNGTLTLNDINTIIRFVPALSATRTHTEDTISWTGAVLTSGSDYTHHENVSSTVSIVDENLRRLVQDATGSNLGAFQFRWEYSANLIGSLIPGSSQCKPIAGTVSSNERMSSYDDSLLVTTVSKGIDDPYWRVVETLNESDVTEYFARDLQILHSPDDPDSANFICDFVEF